MILGYSAIKYTFSMIKLNKLRSWETRSWWTAKSSTPGGKKTPKVGSVGDMKSR